MKKVFYLILTVVILVAIGFGGYYAYRNFDTIKSWFQTEKEEVIDSENNFIDYDLSEEQIETLRSKINRPDVINAEELMYLKYDDSTGNLLGYFSGTYQDKNVWLGFYKFVESKDLLTPEYIVNTLFSEERINSHRSYWVKDYQSGTYYTENKDNTYKIAGANYKLDDIMINLTYTDYDNEQQSGKLNYGFMLFKNGQFVLLYSTQTIEGYKADYPDQLGSKSIDWDKACEVVLNQFKI